MTDDIVLRLKVEAVMEARWKASVRSKAGASDVPFDRKAYQRAYMKEWRKRKRGVLPPEGDT